MSDFDIVKDRIDFRQYVGQYLRVNAEKKVLCLFHADKTPSMHIYSDSFHCFQCKASGDVFDFAMQYHGWTKQEALIELARYAGVELTPLSADAKAKQDKRERLYQVLEFAAQYYTSCLLKGSFRDHPDRDAWLYLTTKRGLTDDAISQARLGYASILTIKPILRDHGFTEKEMLEAGLLIERDDKSTYDRFRRRIMIPIRDHKGRVVGFSGRALDNSQTPKYLYNTGFEKSKTVHAMPSKGGLDAFKTLVVCEGSLDPISAANRGVFNIVSQMGTSLTSEQLALLCKGGVERLVFCLDKDQAGHTATERLVKEHAHAAMDRGVMLYVMTSPHGKDPDDCFREHPELWTSAVDAARSAVDVLIAREVSALPPTADTGDKQRLALRLMPLLKGSNPILESDSTRKLADALGYSVETLAQWVDTRSKITVMPKTPHVKPASVSLPTLEEWVLFYVLNFCNDLYLGRANTYLAQIDGINLVGGRAININDFTGDQTRQLWAIVQRGYEAGEHLSDYLPGYLEDTRLYDAYERCVKADDVSLLLGAPPVVSYHEFIGCVRELRVRALNRLVAGENDPVKRDEMFYALTLLQLDMETAL